MSDMHGTLEPGEILRGRFKIAEVIGWGAYGVVYQALDTGKEGVQWAIKEIWEDAFDDDERQEAMLLFDREVSLLKTLNHTGIPKVIDSFTLGPCHYIVMEYIEGRTPLHAAALRNRAGTIELLADHGAKVNAAERDDGWRPLHSAAYSGSLDAAAMLISKGADINARDLAGETPLNVAEKQGQAKIAGFLKSKGGKQ